MGKGQFLPEKPASAARQYRQRVTPRLPSGYDGNRHLLALLIASAVGVVTPLLLLTPDASLALALALVPVGLAYANIAEYALHRWGGHEVRWHNAPLKVRRSLRGAGSAAALFWPELCS